MAKHGGYRPGSGRPKGSKNRKNKSGQIVPKKSETPDNRDKSKLLPLDYMLNVMNDPTASRSRRDRMAISAAKYIHPLGDRNKKLDRAERAKKAGAGKFATGKSPRVVPFNRER